MSLALSWAEWFRLDAVGLAALIATGQVTAREAAAQAGEAAARFGDRLDAVVELFADAVENPDTGNRAGRLYGVPMFMKDSSFGMAGRRREWGSALAAGQRCHSDCPLTANLRYGGLNLIGRSTLPEWGKAFDTTFRRGGKLVSTLNPWSLAHTPGGSSGGSAALVAAGVVPLAKSGDAAGSTRVPASFTGLVGLKPSRGLLPPSQGTNELANHRIQEGVLTRSIRDQAAALDQMARLQPGAHFIAAPRPPIAFEQSILTDPPAQRIGLSTGRWGATGTCNPPVATGIHDIAHLLESLGHQVEDIADEQVSDWERFWRDFETGWIATAGHWLEVAAAKGMSRTELERTLMPQNALLLAACERLTLTDLRTSLYGNARSTAHVLRMFESIDVLLTPVFSGPVPLAGGTYSLARTDASLREWLDGFRAAARYTALANETGIPSLAVPAGLDAEGLPIGALLHAAPGSDGLLLKLARQIEHARPDWFGAAPSRRPTPADPAPHPAA